MKKSLIILFAFWTMTCALVFVSQQYTLRQEANDPQIQIVRDMRNALNGGVDPSTYQPTTMIDIRGSLSPFVMVFDAEGKVLAHSGELDGAALSVPSRVLEYVENKSSEGVTGGAEHRVTLQPTSKVRLAAVLKVVPLNDPGQRHLVVLAARNLTEVESRIQMMMNLCGSVWSLGIGFSALTFFIARKVRHA